MILITLCPDKMISIAEMPQKEEKKQYKEAGIDNLYGLPETGEIYKYGGNRNIETKKISLFDCDLIIDVGYKKNDLRLSLDYLQEKTGIPVIFIDASFGNLPEAYRKIGGVLGCEEKAEKIARYLEALYLNTKEKRKSVNDPPVVLYAANENGVGLHSSDKVQEKIIEFVGGKPVYPVNCSQCNEINIEKLKEIKVNYIIFNDEESFKELKEATGKTYELWKDFDAVRNESYNLSPGIYHSWFGFDFFAQSIGIIWLCKSVFPRIYEESIVSKVQEFYKLFFDFDITDIEVKKLLGISI